MPTIDELFTLKYGHSLELNRLEQSNDKDAINFVGRAARNNGVTARVSPIKSLFPAAAGTISVALGGQGGAGVAFLQPSPYYCGRDVMVLTPKNYMTDQEKLWWVMCITANRFRFGFGRQANKTLKGLVLPDQKTIPTWVKATNTNHYDGANAPACSKQIPSLDTKSWKAFVLDDLFETRLGETLNRSDFISGTNPCISASSRFNGVIAYIGQPPNREGGTISISRDGSIAEAFYQPEPYWATANINALYPKGFKLTPAVALFICTLLRKEKYRYSYGRKWRIELMQKTTICLPVRADNTPDWKFMEEYIKTLPYSSQIGEQTNA